MTSGNDLSSDTKTFYVLEYKMMPLPSYYATMLCSYCATHMGGARMYAPTVQYRNWPLVCTETINTQNTNVFTQHFLTYEAG